MDDCVVHVYALEDMEMQQNKNKITLFFSLVKKDS